MRATAFRIDPAGHGEDERSKREVGEAVEELVRCATVGKHGDVVLDLVVNGYRCVLMREAPAPAPATQLSPREHEIARMVAEGHANKTIAAVLEISSWTVGTYLRRVFSKLGVTTRAAMVAKLMEHSALPR
jgi:DNA-binding CsgD family transcriptional regulator